MFSEVQKTSSIFFFFFNISHQSFISFYNTNFPTYRINRCLSYFLSKAKKKSWRPVYRRAPLNRTAMPLQNPSSSQSRDVPCGSWERENHLSYWTSRGRRTGSCKQLSAIWFSEGTEVLTTGVEQSHWFRQGERLMEGAATVKHTIYRAGTNPLSLQSRSLKRQN